MAVLYSSAVIRGEVLRSTVESAQRLWIRTTTSSTYDIDIVTIVVLVCTFHCPLR